LEKQEKYQITEKATQAKNQAMISSLSRDMAKNDAETSLGAKQATIASVDAAKYVIAVNERIATMSKKEFDNTKESQESKKSAVQCAIDSINGAISILGRRGALSGIAEANRSAADYFTAASEAASRAADLTQAANIQLSEAYASAQEAAGKAAASIETGRLSGYNASATFSSSGAVEGGLSKSRSINESRSKSISETHTLTRETGYE
jgi:hypothetical protein